MYFIHPVVRYLGKVRQIDIKALNGTKIVVPRLLEDADKRVRHYLQQVLPPADYERFVSMRSTEYC